MKKYLSSLVRKHRMLDKQISEARINKDQLRDMKRLRLNLKDHITRLRRGPERRMT